MEPRRWAHLPIDTNFVGVGYAYTDADITFDPLMKIEDGQAELHTWVAKYIRTFQLLGKSVRLGLIQGYQEGRWSGLLNGVHTSINKTGLLDTRVRFAVNLYGAPRWQVTITWSTEMQQTLKQLSVRVFHSSCRRANIWRTS